MTIRSTPRSAYSRRDLVKYYRMRPERIHVVPEGVDTSRFRPISDAALLRTWRMRVFDADVPYIVYVGKPTERRNLSALICAFAELKAQRALPHKLLIAGADLPGASPFRRIIAERRLERDVVVRGYVTHEEMPLVYNAADLLVYPSSYEGFGMPVLEAMACGTPAIALDNTAFPEFAGGVAHLLPDARVDTLRDGMWEVLRDPVRRQRMSTEGPKRAVAYEWRLVTQRYLDLMIPIAERWERA